MSAIELAERFSSILREWLTPEQLASVNAMNRSDEDKSICHTHDVCDPNQAMIDALASFGIDWSPDEMPLIDDAWGIAKANGFGANECEC